MYIWGLWLGLGRGWALSSRNSALERKLSPRPPRALHGSLSINDNNEKHSLPVGERAIQQPTTSKKPSTREKNRETVSHEIPVLEPVLERKDPATHVSWRNPVSQETQY